MVNKLHENLLSQEIVIALTAPIGVDLERIMAIFEKAIYGSYPYQPEFIKLSDSFPKKVSEARKKKKDGTKIEDIGNPFNELGKEIKKYKSENDKLSLKIVQGNFIVAADNFFKTKKLTSPNDKMGEIAIKKIKYKQQKCKTPTVYIIQQLKRPEEIDILKHVYGRAFYLVGIFADEFTRKNYIKEKLKESALEDINCKVDELMRKDENEKYDFGQKIQETFSQADYFVHYEPGYPEKTGHKISRFINLILNDQLITPSKEEVGMCYAYVASMRSSDLSRQVGAAIVDQDTAVLSVGTNDVPKAGGDMYWEEDHSRHRDIEDGEDSNDVEKMEIAEEFANKLIKHLKENFKRSKDSVTKEELRELLKDSKLDNLLEFGRAVHAETDAIVSAARRGVTIKGAILHTTTFPCHLCIKNIIDAGIKTVIYIHPYPKSQAYKLHKDAINIPPTNVPVLLRPYEGVSPMRFFDLFKMTKRKNKESGKVVFRETPEPRLKRDPRGEKSRENKPK